MINVIIYEDCEECQKRYQEIVREYFNRRNMKVKFYVFKCYRKDLEIKLCELKGKKIYILDIEVPGKSGLDVARIIRANGDWESPLIIVTSYDHLKSAGFTSKMLMLDFISKKEDLKRRISETLDTAYKILNIPDSYTFQYNGELYHILYRDILYFEKDLNDNYTFLHAKEDTYVVKESIVKISNQLKNYKNFVKTHRSCIINTDNVEYVDFKTNLIYFSDETIDLLSKANRDELRNNLRFDQIRK